MKYLLFTCLILLLTSLAGADVVSLSTEGNSIVISNSQNNSVWSPSAVIYTSDDVVPVTLSIYRYGNGQQVLLSSISATASNLIWTPQARYIFASGSALAITSSVANFTIQLHREPAHD